MKIFYDGTQLTKYALHPLIQGFTTNVTFMAQAKQTNYKNFYDTHSALINDRPISLQVFTDDDETIAHDAHTLTSFGPNIYVKIPIIKSNGASNLPIIERLLQENIKINVTAIFSIEQIKSLYSIVSQQNQTTPLVVSIFAGRISDTGTDPFPIVLFACTLFAHLPHIEVLWAGCKEVLSIEHAKRAGAAIITIPDSILDRLNRQGMDLTEFSKETVRSFNADGQNNHLTIT
jgi:transaldolase